MSIASVVAQHSALLASLDRMAALPGEPCPACGSAKNHWRCSKCNVCTTQAPPQPSRYQGGCVACVCGARASMYANPVRDQRPRPPFAATFSAELAVKIRKGWAPSDKQIALARKLDAETAAGPAAKPTTAERDAVDFLTERSRAWKPVLALLTRDCPATVAAFKYDETRATDWQEATRKLSRESTAAAREAVRSLLDQATGCSRFPDAASWQQAISAVPVKVGPRGGKTSADPVLARAVDALAETHAFIVREKWVIEAPKAA